MHFGLYLYRKGIITAEQLVSALEVQTRSLVRIGQLALEEGVLSARQVFHVLQSQQHAPRERFGELAIDMGLMTRDELLQLLMIQADRKVPLEEILIRQGVLSRAQVNAELSAFRKQNGTPRQQALPPHTTRRPFARPTFAPREEAWLAT